MYVPNAFCGNFDIPHLFLFSIAAVVLAFNSALIMPPLFFGVVCGNVIMHIRLTTPVSTHLSQNGNFNLFVCNTIYKFLVTFLPLQLSFRS